MNRPIHLGMHGCGPIDYEYIYIIITSKYTIEVTI